MKPLAEDLHDAHNYMLIVILSNNMSNTIQEKPISILESAACPAKIPYAHRYQPKTSNVL